MRRADYRTSKFYKPRGPVFGSMFIAGVLIGKGDQNKLRDLGVKDSKVLSDVKRELLVPEIKKIAKKFIVKEITANQIDKLMKTINLNAIELQIFAKIIEELNPDKVIIDLPEKNGEKFILRLKELLKNFLKNKNVEFVAENKADVKYPVVSAASILAKSERERHVKKLYKKYGRFFHTGYSHDEDTIKFLEAYVKKNKKLPEEARKCWSTSKKILDKFAQKKLGEF